MKLSALLLLGLLFPTLNFAMEMCETHIPCPANTFCGCNAGASSAYHRYFYIDFTGIKKNTAYECQLTSDIPGIYYLEQNTKLPTGATYSCTSERCPFFPLTLQINTREMQIDSGDAEIKILLPASDIPYNLSMSCQQQMERVSH